MFTYSGALSFCRLYHEKPLEKLFLLSILNSCLHWILKAHHYTDFLSEAWRFPYPVLPIVIIYEICLKVFMTSENLLALL